MMPYRSVQFEEDALGYGVVEMAQKVHEASVGSSDYTEDTDGFAICLRTVLAEWSKSTYRYDSCVKNLILAALEEYDDFVGC